MMFGPHEVPRMQQLQLALWADHKIVFFLTHMTINFNYLHIPFSNNQNVKWNSF